MSSPEKSDQNKVENAEEDAAKKLKGDLQGLIISDHQDQGEAPPIQDEDPQKPEEQKPDEEQVVEPEEMG